MTTIQEICPHVHNCGNCIRIDESIDKQRTGQLAWLKRFLTIDNIDWVDSPKSMHYRSRIRLRVNKDGTMGYFKPKSHTLVPIDHCTIADEPINTAIKELGSVPFPAKTIEFRSNGLTVVANVSSQGSTPDQGHPTRLGRWSPCRTDLMDTKCGDVVKQTSTFVVFHQFSLALSTKSIKESMPCW